MEFHEVANLFPFIEGEEFDNLVKDIKENGLQQPIWTYQGKIIDGRNRYRACLASGTTPKFQEWDGKGSLVAFTISLNVKRRHLTSSQLGIISLKVEEQFAIEAAKNVSLGGANHQGNQYTETELEGLPNLANLPIEPIHAAEETAKLLGVSHSYVSTAKAIERDAPELLDHVLAGTLTIPDAKTISDLPKERRDKIVEKVVQRKEEEGKRVSRSVKEAIWEDEIPSKLSDPNLMKIMSSSESPEWYTPEDVIARVLDLFGEIDLDPCSNSHDKPNVPAHRLYTREDNGLNKAWYGKVYMNPPYGREISEWTEKLAEEFNKGRVEEAIALVPGRIDTAWFQPMYNHLICTIKGRLSFSEAESGAPFPSVAIYMGKRREAFIEAFKSVGPILERVA